MKSAGLSGTTRVYILSRLFASAGTSVYVSVGPLLAAVLFHASPAEMGLITATSIVASMLLRIPVSTFVDSSEDERKLMAVWGVLYAAAASLVPLLWLIDQLSFASFLGCLALASAASSFLSAAGYRMVNLLSPAGERTRALGTLHGAHGVGDIAGQSAGGALSGLIGPPLAMILSPILSIAGVLLLPRTPARRSNVAKQTLIAKGPDNVLTAGDFWRISSSVIRRPFIIFCGAAACANGLSEPVVVLFLIHNAQMPIALVGLALGCGAVGGVMGGLVVGPAVDSRGYRTVVSVGLFLMAMGAGLLLVGGIHTHLAFPVAVAFELLSAFGGVLIIASTMGRLQELVNVRSIATTMTVAELSLEGVGLAGIGVGSMLAANFGLAAGLCASLAMYLALLMILTVNALFRQG